MAPQPTVVLITGANSGIGLATAKAIASASPSYHVIMAGRSASKIEAAVSEVGKAPGIQGQVSSVQLDVLDTASVEAAAKHIGREHGKLDVLVNNAGVASQATDLRQQHHDTLMTNVAGVAVVTEVFTDLLLKSPRPYLIHVSSSLGSLQLAADPGSHWHKSDWTVYRTSKAALNMMALQDVKHLGAQGVKVFIVCPGLVESNLRGTKAEQVSAGGRAGDPAVSGQTMLNIIEGKRDADVGKFVHKDGVYPW